MIPRARHDGIFSQPVEEDLIVYDVERNNAHRLNRTAALVWRLADGAHTDADIAAALQQELGPAADENLVSYTLDRLSAAQLLEEPQPRSADETRISRRQFIRKAGLVGAVALLLPVVTTIVAPTPAQAATGSS